MGFLRNFGMFAQAPGMRIANNRSDGCVLSKVIKRIMYHQRMAHDPPSIIQATSALSNDM